MTNDMTDLKALMDKIITRAMPEDFQHIPKAQPRETGPLDAGLGAPWVITLHIDNIPITFQLEVSRKFVLGRTNQKSNSMPDLDLTPYHGQRKGVSRLHAVIAAEKDRLMITDLNTTNGTYVNDLRLTPHLPYRLRHGDSLRMGHLIVTIGMEMVPVHDTVFLEQPWIRLDHSATAIGAGRRILIVEANSHTADALSTILTSLDYDVQVAREMTDAFYAVSKRLPHAIIIDIDVGTIHGLELCRYIQRLAHREMVPLIIVSEDTNQAHIDEIMNAGVDVFLGKPVGVNELVRTIASVTQNVNVDA